MTGFYIGLAAIVIGSVIALFIIKKKKDDDE